MAQRQLTDEDVAEVRACFHSGHQSLKDLALIYDMDYRYLHKVVHYEVRTKVIDLPETIRRPKRKWSRCNQ